MSFFILSIALVSLSCRPRSVTRKRNFDFSRTHLILLWFSRRFLMFMFISANFLSSKSSSCECVIFSQILKSGVNLSWRTSTTWENDSIFSHVTMMVLGIIWLGIEQVQGLISRLIEQCSEALAVKENIVKSSVVIVHALPLTFTQSFIFCWKFWCLWNNYEVFFTTCCNQFPIFQFTFKLSYRVSECRSESHSRKIKTRDEFLSRRTLSQSSIDISLVFFSRLRFD